MHVWSTYDRLPQYVSHIQKNEEKELNLPLSDAIEEEQRNLLIVRRKMQGGDRVIQFIENTKEDAPHYKSKSSCYELTTAFLFGTETALCGNSQRDFKVTAILRFDKAK